MKTRPTIIAVCLVIVAALAFPASFRHYKHVSSPEYVLEVLDRAQTRDDLTKFHGYWTPECEQTLLWAYDKFHTQRTKDPGLKLFPPQIENKTCKIPFASNDGVAGYFLITSLDHWRLEDIVLTHALDRDISLSMNYWHKHEFLAILHTFPAEVITKMGKSFLDGFTFGKRLF